MRRFLLVLAGLASVLTASAVPAAASATAAFCVPAAAATYRHTFDGAKGIVTITAVRRLCSGQDQSFSLVSYTAGGFPAGGQFVYDTDRGTLTASRRRVTLSVAVPDCYTQVGAIVGTAVRSEITSDATPYGPAVLGSSAGDGGHSIGSPAWYAGGTAACAAAPTVTFANACDGTLSATLANDDSADVQAVFLTGNRRIRISPGRFTTIKATKGKTLTIRDSSFVTYIGTWRTPTAGCASPTQSAPARVTLPAPAPTTATIAKAAPSVSATTDSDPEESPAAAYSTNPAALLATTPPTTLAQTHMGTGSMITIGFGFLMIGAGMAVLARLVRNSRRPA